MSEIIEIISKIIDKIMFFKKEKEDGRKEAYKFIATYIKNADENIIKLCNIADCIDISYITKFDKDIYNKFRRLSKEAKKCIYKKFGVNNIKNEIKNNNDIMKFMEEKYGKGKFHESNLQFSNKEIDIENISKQYESVRFFGRNYFEGYKYNGRVDVIITISCDDLDYIKTYIEDEEDLFLYMFYKYYNNKGNK